MAVSAALEARMEAAAQSLAPAQAISLEPSLAEAVHYALFPAGARARPLLTLTIGQALGVRDETLRAACAVELIHNASLVHDDMPCFDDADTRRGKPSVVKRYGPAMALLVGDALLSLAFREAALLCSASLRQRIAEVACQLIVGQSMELSQAPRLETYHAHKTACLFSLAAEAPAHITGLACAPFAALGDAIGLSYQLADDLFDHGAPEPNDNKARGRDAIHLRPNAATSLGMERARDAFEKSLLRIEQAVAALPCATQSIEAFVCGLTTRFKKLALSNNVPSMHAGQQRHHVHHVAFGS